MKLYLSSYRLPVPEELSKLTNKPLNSIYLALISNAKDYYAERARKVKVDAYVEYFKNLGIKTDVIDLREVKDSNEIKDKLKMYDVVWAAGGNTFCLRYEMRRSGFEAAIKGLLANGLVYGGDSAGALVAGYQIGGLGIEAIDNPEFAETVIAEGLNLVPFVVIPHADNPEFIDTTNVVRAKVNSGRAIELNDSQAVIFENTKHRLVSAD